MIEQLQKAMKHSQDRPAGIPERLYFGIREVSKLCDVEPSVLRYWEKQFEGLSPQKRSNGRRHYSREHILLIRHIKRLLYVEGFTVSGAKQQLSEKSGGYAGGFAKERVSALLQDVISRLSHVHDQLVESVD